MFTKVKFSQLRVVAKKLKTFECQHCNIRFHLLDDFNEHNALNHPSNFEIREKARFKCIFCEQEFPLRHLLLQHLRAVHKNGGRLSGNNAASEYSSFKCEKCELSFQLYHLMREHFKSKHNLELGKHGKDNSNAECGVLIQNGITGSNNLSIRNNNQNRNPTSSFLERSREVPKRIPKVKCPDCNMKFSFNFEMFKHQKKNHTEVPRHQEAMNYIHKKSQSEEKPKNVPQNKQRNYQCGSCNDKFPYRFLLFKHNLDHHRKTEKNSSSFLNQSRYGGSQNKPIKHRIEVPRTFNTDSDEEQFLDHDELQESFVCNHCDSAFVTQASLNRHLPKCNRDPLHIYSCGNCNQNFGSEMKLNKHQMTCIGSNRDVQDSKLSNSQSEILHPCNSCDHTFPYMYLLAKHTYNAHNKHLPNAEPLNQKPKSCPLCNKKISNKPNVRRHLKNIHKKSDKQIYDLINKQNNILSENHQMSDQLTDKEPIIEDEVMSHIKIEVDFGELVETLSVADRIPESRIDHQHTGEETNESESELNGQILINEEQNGETFTEVKRESNECDDELIIEMNE